MSIVKKISDMMIFVLACSMCYTVAGSVLPISGVDVDSDVVRQARLTMVNDARSELGRESYVLDLYLTNTAQTRANHLRDNDITQGTHVRENEAFRDSDAIRRWFDAQGVTPGSFTESNGWNVYRCNSNCTQTLSQAIRYTYNFFASEAGRSYQPHRQSMINQTYKIMGVGIAAGNGKYYLVMHVADRISVVDPSLIFSDTAGHQYRESIEYLYERGIVKGYDNKTFGPDNPISRAEMTKIVVASRVSPSVMGSGSKCFPDVRTEWYAPYICYAKTNNIIKGFDDGTFKPQAMVTVAQGLKIALNAFALGITEGMGTLWYKPYLDFVYDQNIFPDRSLSANRDMTRGQMAYLVHQLFLQQK